MSCLGRSMGVMCLTCGHQFLAHRSGAAQIRRGDCHCPRCGHNVLTTMIPKELRHKIK